jgi:hypothetical protein
MWMPGKFRRKPEDESQGYAYSAPAAPAPPAGRELPRLGGSPAGPSLQLGGLPPSPVAAGVMSSMAPPPPPTPEQNMQQILGGMRQARGYGLSPLVQHHDTERLAANEFAAKRAWPEPARTDPVLAGLRAEDLRDRILHRGTADERAGQKHEKVLAGLDAKVDNQRFLNSDDQRGLRTRRVESQIGASDSGANLNAAKEQEILLSLEPKLQKIDEQITAIQDARALAAWRALRQYWLDQAELGEFDQKRADTEFAQFQKQYGLAGKLSTGGMFGTNLRAPAQEAASAGMAAARGKSGAAADSVRAARSNIAVPPPTGRPAAPAAATGVSVSGDEGSAIPAGPSAQEATPQRVVPGSAREGGVGAAARVDLERRQQAGTGRGRRTAEDIRKELAALRAQR